MNETKHLNNGLAYTSSGLLVVRVEHICVCSSEEWVASNGDKSGGGREGGRMVSLNPEILKCSDGGAYNVPLPDIQRGGNDAAGNTPDIEKRPRPTPWRFTVSF